MKFSDETLIAYVDGELDAATRAEFDAALAADAELAQRLKRHVALATHIHEAFDAVLDEPVPQHLLDAAGGRQPTADVINLAQRRDAKQARGRRWSWPQWGAIAAGIVAGVAVGRYGAIESPQFVMDNGHVVARGALAHALSTQLASTQSADAAIKIGISFKAHSGEYCRTFIVAKGAAGMACKDRNDWRVQVLAQPEAAGDGAYRMAASALPETLTRAVDAVIDGMPFDAEQEAAARRKAWQ